ncbi:MAG: LLM class flavin-dependent oxidoreductase, partial [Aeromonas veronii]
DQVRHGLKALLAETGADELMFNGPIVDHQARLRSFEIAAELMQSL